MQIATATNNDGNPSPKFNLEQNEMIIGIFGEKYDQYYNSFKSLGFIIGTIN